MTRRALFALAFCAALAGCQQPTPTTHDEAAAQARADAERDRREAEELRRKAREDRDAAEAAKQVVDAAAAERRREQLRLEEAERERREAAERSAAQQRLAVVDVLEHLRLTWRLEAVHTAAVEFGLMPQEEQRDVIEAASKIGARKVENLTPWESKALKLLDRRTIGLQEVEEKLQQWDVGPLVAVDLIQARAKALGTRAAATRRAVQEAEQRFGSMSSNDQLSYIGARDLLMKERLADMVPHQVELLRRMGIHDDELDRLAILRADSAGFDSALAKAKIEERGKFTLVGKLTALRKRIDDLDDEAVKKMKALQAAMAK